MKLERNIKGQFLKTHGMFGTVIYSKWQQAKNRCNNAKDKDFRKYGGRGIEFRWNSFEEFYKDMGESFNIHCEEYGIANTTLDRVNVNGHYSKENCRWATQKEQANNRRTNVYINFNGISHTLTEWARISGVSAPTIAYRLRHMKDIPLEKCIFAKPSRKKKNVLQK